MANNHLGGFVDTLYVDGVFTYIEGTLPDIPRIGLLTNFNVNSWQILSTEGCCVEDDFLAKVFRGFGFGQLAWGFAVDTSTGRLGFAFFKKTDTTDSGWGLNIALLEEHRVPASVLEELPKLLNQKRPASLTFPSQTLIDLMDRHATWDDVKASVVVRLNLPEKMVEINQHSFRMCLPWQANEVMPEETPPSKGKTPRRRGK